jgi:class 3 adenylate cyclase
MTTTGPVPPNPADSACAFNIAATVRTQLRRPVHIGARVSALADANDVLVSSTLRDLVIGSGLELEDRGAHALKGVPGEWRLFAVAT